MGPITRQGTLNLTPLHVAGKKAKAEETKKFQNSVDHIIMRLICVRGLVPNVLNSPEWKELMNKLNSTYKPKSSDAFRDSFIPQEAVFVQSKQIELLKAEEDLTLTFDGTTICSNESFYTAHATTSSRKSFFLDGHEGSGESHNRKWITDNLMKTIESVGKDKWAAIVSDNTNVTKAARCDTIDLVPTMLDLWDCIHHIQNTIKDITNLLAFKPASPCRCYCILSLLIKSSFGTFKLREARTLGDGDGPVNALQKVGKTRFGTHWLAAVAIDPCLPFIRDLVITKTIKFKVQGLFANKFNRKYNDFSEDLLQYSTVVAPLIRSLWSLEAAHANTADVLIFWLASAATLKDLFDQDVDKTGIPRSLANEVTEIYNKRYEEFFKNNIYFVAFLLDPRMSIIYLNGWLMRIHF
ncbi:hypothetical protein BYT27DRAFT_7075277 [Phlegmacium glaucopus]|nr:hypothetical protein BYT27DRAFT_7075277 [Phlegmacium glaucopus]